MNFSLSSIGIAESISEQLYEDVVSMGYNAVHSCLKDEGEKFHVSDLKVAIIVCSTTGSLESFLFLIVLMLIAQSLHIVEFTRLLYLFYRLDVFGL